MALTYDKPNTTVMLMGESTEEFIEGEVDDDGVVRNDEGHPFAEDEFQIVGEVRNA